MSDQFSERDRRALRAVAVQFFVNGALYASFIPRLPEIRDRVGVSVAGIGILLALGASVGLVGSALVSAAIGRFGTRTVMLVSSAAVSISLAVVGLATSPIVLWIGLSGMALFDGLVDVAMNMQGSWLSARRHAPVMNRLHGLWSFGTLIGGLASSQVAAAQVSLPVHLLFAAGVLAALLGYVGPRLLAVDEHHATARVHAATGPDPAGSAGSAGADDPAGTHRRPRRGEPRSAQPVVAVTLLAFGLAGFFSVAIETGAADWAAFRLSDDFGAGPGLAALSFVAVVSGMTIARLAGDWATVRLGERRHRELSLLLAGAGLAVAAFAPLEALVMVGYLATGLGAAPLAPALYDHAARRPGRTGAGLGALTAGLRVALLGIPVIIGTTATAFDRVGIAIAIVALPSVVGFRLATRHLR